MDSFAIKGALVYDGSGAAPYEGDLLVKGGLIEALGPSGSIPSTGAFSIDAKGLSLAPGFIDAHSHSDVSILAAPEGFGKLSQGVCTEVVGNCGLSVFPLTGPVREHLQEIYKEYDVKLNWDSLDGYAKELERRHPSLNIASLCGHNTLRACVLGYGNAPCGGAEWLKMRELLEDCLAKGAAGLSAGLIYVPGKFAAPEEMKAVAGALAASGKPYATHLRSEGAGLLEALEEAVEAARCGSGRLHVSHLKTSGKDNWGKLPAVLELLGNARRSGMEITADRYPYIHSKTNLSVILPPPFGDMDDVRIQETLAAPAEFEKLVSLLAAAPKRRSWDSIIIASTNAQFAKGLCGMRLDEASARLGISPELLCAELMRQDAPGSLAAFGGMSPENLERILSLPWVCCGSDESARPPDYSLGRSHPRGFGSFPRFLKAVSEKSGMAEAVRRATSLPAQTFGLEGRGLLKAGFAADMALFDEAALADAADFASPHSPAKGVEKVWVNGALSFDGGSAKGAGSGRFLAVRLARRRKQN